MKTLVSILIPCYNAERWVAQAIESALAQTWPAKEIIVVDDGSTDGSLDVIKRFGGRVHWETGPNRGGNVARNRLLELARGGWLQYLDADDYLLPDKIARQMAFLATRPEEDIVFGPVTMEHVLGTEVRRELLEIPEPHDPWVLLARWYMPQTGAALWRKWALLDIGGWKADQPCCQEHELYLRLLMAGKRFAYCPDGGAVYRQWGEHTVCKKDIAEVHRRRLDIEQRAENFLRAHEELTKGRLHAINQARFETARIAWQYDSSFASEIMSLVGKTSPRFVPDRGGAAPRHYRVALQLLGFKTTEKIADWGRRLVRRRPRQSTTFHEA